MLHRRPGHSSDPASGAPPFSPHAAPSPSSPQNKKQPNKTYTPLRRQSSGLYASQTPASGQRARYNLPSPSPVIIPSSPGYTRRPSAGGYGPASPGQGYFPPNGNTLGLGGYGNGHSYSDGAGGGSGAGWEDGVQGVVKLVRVSLGRLGKGLEDAARMDRSWTLVWR